MKYLSAVLLALAIVAAQVLHGGVRDPALSAPAYALLVLAAAAAAIALWRNANPVTSGALVAVCLFGGYVIWRCVEAPDPFLGRLDFTAALSGVLAFVVAACGLSDVKSRLVFLGLLGAACLAQSVTGIVQFATGHDFTPLGWFSEELRMFYHDRYLTRAHGFYLNPNHYAWFCGWAALFCMALGCWGRVTVIARIVLIYFALFFIGCDVVSGSRGGILSLFAALGFFSLTSVVAIFATMRRGRFGFALSALALVLVCFGAGWFVYSSNWVAQGRMDNLFVVDVRSYLFEHAWRQFQSAPLLGAGPGMFLYAARIYRAGYQPQDAIYAHDDWIQTLAEYGLIGFGLAVVAIAVLFGGGLRRFFTIVQYRAEHDDRPLSNSAAILLASVASLVMFAMHSIIDFNMHVPANALLAGATFGLLASREPMANPHRLETGIMRAFGFVVIAALATPLSLNLWRHAPADYEGLLGANAVARGEVREALARTEKGLKWTPNDSGLLLTRGRALYAYESFIVEEAARNAPPAPEESEDDENAEDNGDEIPVVEENVPELSPAEREKIYRSSAESLAAAVAQRPMERGYRVELARSLAEVGEQHAARDQFVEAIRLDPNADFAYAAYGDYFYDHDDLPSALALYSMGRFAPEGNVAEQRRLALIEEMAPQVEEPDPAPEEESSDSSSGADAQEGTPP